MDQQQAAARLDASAAIVAALIRDVADEQARWKPTPDDWSILEVANHLYDEEREDFRARLDLTLHHPGRPLPPIDPQGWVTARDYNGRDLAESLARFLDERQRSVAWLRSLADPDWSRLAANQQWPLRAGDLLAAWVAHDLLHLRQLVELHYRWIARETTPYQVDYAGPW
jgi:hypothetical protein